MGKRNTPAINGIKVEKANKSCKRGFLDQNLADLG